MPKMTTVRKDADFSAENVTGLAVMQALLRKCEAGAHDGSGR